MRILTSIVPVLQDPDAIAIVARCYLLGTVLQNRMLIRARVIPPLYSSNVRYEPEPRWMSLRDRNGRVLKFEEFATALDVLERGWGDCDDLAPWICAERQEHCDCGHWCSDHMQQAVPTPKISQPRHPFNGGGQCKLCACQKFCGEPADILVSYRVRRDSKGKQRAGFHALCRRGDGTTEDPSRYLGL